MPVFNSLNNHNDRVKTYDFTSQQETGNFLTKVFGIMFMSLLLTALVSYGLAYILHSAILQENAQVLETFLIVMIVSLIGLLVLSIVLPIALRRGKHSIFLYYVLYIGCMCVCLSTLYLCYDMEILAITFGITSLVFGIMSFLGYVSKGSFAGVRSLLLGLIFGSVILTVVNLFLQSSQIGWIISFAVFAFVLLVTMYDVRRIKDIAASGSASKNLAFYCSFILYVDFINIFLRILRFVAQLSRRK